MRSVVRWIWATISVMAGGVYEAFQSWENLRGQAENWSTWLHVEYEVELSGTQVSLIAAFMFASASAIQPLNYLLLVFATAIGIVVFGESLELWTTIGASIIVASGLFIIVRERLNKSPDDKV